MTHPIESQRARCTARHSPSEGGGLVGRLGLTGVSTEPTELAAERGVGGIFRFAPSRCAGDAAGMVKFAGGAGSVSGFGSREKRRRARPSPATLSSSSAVAAAFPEAGRRA